MLNSLLNCTVEYDGFYVVSKNDVRLFDTLKEASDFYAKYETNNPKGVFAFVKYGNLKKTLIGKETNVSPYKQDYQSLRTQLKDFVLLLEWKG